MAIIDKVWNISWDMWEHRNHIKHNTMHPRKLAALENIKEQLQNIYNTLHYDSPLQGVRSSGYMGYGEWK
jgi:hypothetical protein